MRSTMTLYASPFISCWCFTVCADQEPSDYDVVAECRPNHPMGLHCFAVDERLHILLKHIMVGSLIHSPLKKTQIIHMYTWANHMGKVHVKGTKQLPLLLCPVKTGWPYPLRSYTAICRLPLRTLLPPSISEYNKLTSTRFISHVDIYKWQFWSQIIRKKNQGCMPRYNLKFMCSDT